ncbi:MAG: hypothetical protein ACXAAK_03010, partial [Candidatus Thorarchaeota archaeon]
VMYLADETYTGLGFSGPDGGQTLVCKSITRYYQADNVTPREGVSAIQLHETMHSLGFSHTWVNDHYASDFSYGPMTYFAYHNGSSSFDRNWAQGTYLDQMEAQLWNDFQVRRVVLDDSAYPKAFMAEEQALKYFHLARMAYDQMDWMEAYLSLTKANDWSRRMLYGASDNTLPLINDWGTEYVSGDQFLYWAHITDQSGIENVTLFIQTDYDEITIYPCSQTYNNWSVVVPEIDHPYHVDIWLVAFDWGMNMVEGGYITISSRFPPIPPPMNNLIGFIGVISIFSLVLVIGLRNIVKSYHLS